MATPRPDQEWRPQVKTLWRDVHKEFELGPDGLELLRMACYSLDRYLEAKEILDTEGITFKTASGQVKKHPAIEIEKISRQGFLQAIKSLGLELEDDEPKRGPGRPTVYGC